VDEITSPGGRSIGIRLLAVEILAEIDRMHFDVRRYLSLHPKEL
jgi:hypothetical protein